MYYPSYNAYYQQSGMLWVSGEQEAYAYPVAPNAAVALWDSNKQSVYIKQADASGRPTIKILDYTERSVGVSPSGDSNNTNYASKSDIEAISKEIEAIKSRQKGDKDE